MEELEFVLGTKKSPIKVSLKHFKGRKLIDIRKYFYDKSDNCLPTKKGVALNQFQLSELLSTISSESAQIKGFFNVSSSFDENLNLNVIDSTIGREFDIKYQNGEAEVIISKNLSEKIGDENLEVFKKLLDSVYKTSLDIIEDDNDINLFMDVLNSYLSKKL